MMSCNSSDTPARSARLWGIMSWFACGQHPEVMAKMLSVFTEKHKGVAGSALKVDMFGIS